MKKEETKNASFKVDQRELKIRGNVGAWKSIVGLYTGYYTPRPQAMVVGLPEERREWFVVRCTRPLGYFRTGLIYYLSTWKSIKVATAISLMPVQPYVSLTRVLNLFYSHKTNKSNYIKSQLTHALFQRHLCLLCWIVLKPVDCGLRRVACSSLQLKWFIEF